VDLEYLNGQLEKQGTGNETGTGNGNGKGKRERKREQEIKRVDHTTYQDHITYRARGLCLWYEHKCNGYLPSDCCMKETMN